MLKNAFKKTFTHSFKKSDIVSWLFKRTLYVFLRVLFFTYRVRVISQDISLEDMQHEKGIYYFWHQHILSGMYFFFSKKLRGSCVVSPSKDGKIAGYICGKLGFNVLYGSSHKSPVSLLKQSIRTLKTHKQLCIVGDGSRGPAKKLQKGIEYLAAKTQVPIIFVECKPYTSYTFKKSWDQFKVPLPFSKIDIIIHSPRYISREDIK